ncbi:GIY-YIG nuclease family protein [Streptomyces cyaneofuscatus]|uniref:GIY-YIG nuclease family protein n=1 Tax=Streptomyces cyaneofuscatus TaxID=66883 RepID=UPI00365A2877
MARATAQGAMPQPGTRTSGTDETAVYRLFGVDGQLLYVGLGRNPMNRWSSHAEQHPWWPSVATFTVVWYPTRPEAAAAEKAAIKSEAPVHNVHSTVRHGLVTGAGVRAALGGRRNFSERRSAVQ